MSAVNGKTLFVDTEGSRDGLVVVTSRRSNHSTLAPAYFTTLAHFSVSSPISVP